MTVLVTGSSGRIGSRLVRTLAARGTAVRGLDLKPLEHPPAGYDEVVGHLDDREAASAALAGVRLVFHLGALMSWDPRDDEALHRTNCEGTRQLIEAARGVGARRFVFASSGEVYPEGAPRQLPIDEAHPTEPRSTYGLTKLIGEEMVRHLGRSGMETVILRFSHTQDARELLDPTSFFSGPRFFLRSRLAQQRRLGNAAQVAALEAADIGREAHVLACSESDRPFRMHITDSRDMLAGLLLAGAHCDAAGETFNLGATVPVDFGQAVPAMAAITGLPIVRVQLPGPGVFYETSNERIRARLGFEPRYPFATMLAEAGEAWRDRAG
jgi:UDP-glucose 4-epimerase